MSAEREIIPIGLVRSVDKLGRLSLPKSLRDRLEISAGTPLEYLTTILDGQQAIVLCKFDPKRGFTRLSE